MRRLATSAPLREIQGAHLDGPKAPRGADVSIAGRFTLGRFPPETPDPNQSMPQPKRISGRDNPEFKRFLAVRNRKDRGLILVEGPKLLAEAVRSKLPVAAIAFDESFADSHGSLRAPEHQQTATPPARLGHSPVVP